MPPITLLTHLSDTCDTLIDNIIYLQITLRKITKNYILISMISDHQMTCCILPNYSVVKREDREYIELRKHK